MIAVGRVLNPHVLLEAKIIIVSLWFGCQIAEAAIVGDKVVAECQLVHGHQRPDLIPGIKCLDGKAVDDHVVEMATGTFSQNHGTVLFGRAAGAVHRDIVEGGL